MIQREKSVFLLFLAIKYEHYFIVNERIFHLKVYHIILNKNKNRKNQLKQKKNFRILIYLIGVIFNGF